MFLQPLNLVVSSLFLSNLETKARACKCLDPLLSGANSKNIISTGWSSLALKSKLFDSNATNTFGLSISGQLA